MQLDALRVKYDDLNIQFATYKQTHNASAQQLFALQQRIDVLTNENTSLKS